MEKLEKIVDSMKQGMKGMETRLKEMFKEIMITLVRETYISDGGKDKHLS